tara:strand:- start:85 stop:372 length:288 start_codon:yes stop_codon:yes gene_type:complete
MEKITSENWTFTGFKANELLALISLGAKPVVGSAEPDLVYFLTVMDDEGVDVFQQEYSSLEMAIESINQKYSHWTFQDRAGSSSSGSGCGDCAAH